LVTRRIAVFAIPIYLLQYIQETRLLRNLIKRGSRISYVQLLIYIFRLQMALQEKRKKLDQSNSELLK